MGLELEETVPVNWKSSNLNVPVPVALDNEMTTETVPVSPFIAFATFVEPVDDPPVDTEPLPTLVPLIVIDQFCAPVALRLVHMLKDVTESSYPDATSKVSVIVGVPEELLKDNACPELPAKLVQAPVLFDQDELLRFALIVPGATV